MALLVKENANLSKESDTAAGVKLRMQSLLWFVTAIASLGEEIVDWNNRNISWSKSQYQILFVLVIQQF